MKQQRMKNTNKGITLIALVITIIVMLILVAVTISMAVNGGLFEYAGKATGDTNNAIKAEQQLADGGIKVGETYYNSIDEYLKINGYSGEKNVQKLDIRCCNDYDENDDVRVIATIEYEPGMTWGEWVESSYNKPFTHCAGEDKLYVDNYGYVCSMSFASFWLADMGNGYPVEVMAEDVIDPTLWYEIYM